MTQTLIVSAPDAVTRAWLLTPAVLRDPADDLRDAVAVALGTDRLANADDTLPNAGDTDRRGWWGDLDADALWSAWPIGTRLWLLGRASLTDGGARQGSTQARADTYAREALKPFVDAKIATRVQVDVERAGLNALSLTATIYRGPLAAIQLQYATLWSTIGV